MPSGLQSQHVTTTAIRKATYDYCGTGFGLDPGDQDSRVTFLIGFPVASVFLFARDACVDRMLLRK